MRSARRLALAASVAALAGAALAPPAAAAAGNLVTVAITSPAAGATVFGPITVSGTASSKFAISSVSVAIDSGSSQPATGGTSWSFGLATDSLSNGSHTLTATAIDVRGRVASTSESVTVNNTPPSIAINSPAAGALVSGSFTVSGTASSPAAGLASVQVRVDSGAFQPSPNAANWSVAFDSTSLADGGHTVTAVATDTVGHSTSTSVTVTVSNSPPTISIASPTAGSTVSGSITVSGSTSSLAGVTSVQVQVDANAAVTASGTTSWTLSLDTTTLSNGAHTVAATATDSLGRTSTTSVSVNVSNLIATQSSPWYLQDSTGNVSTVNQTMSWTGATNVNSPLPTGTIFVHVNSTIQPNDANPADTCTQDVGTGFWTCVHTITSADLEFNSVLGWSLHYAFQLQVEYPPTTTFVIGYNGDSTFAASSAQAANT